MNVSNDGTIHRKLSADASPFHPLYTKNEAIKIDKKAAKIGQEYGSSWNMCLSQYFMVIRKWMRIEKLPSLMKKLTDV